MYYTDATELCFLLS